jgi:hypothetical protein
LDHRNAESRGFAAAGRSAREDIAASQGDGNSRLLYGRGFGIFEVFDAAEKRSIQLKFRKN